MTCYELVNRMIATCARVAMEPNNGSCKVTLTEPGCVNSTATIFGVPQRAVVFRLDENFVLERIFRGSFGECKRSDFVIVAEQADFIVIVYIEMKLTSASNSAVQKQLEGARCFVHYMQELGRTFGDYATFLQNAKHRFVSIKHTRSLRKRRTAISRTGDIHDCPQRALTISWPHHVEFGQLAGGN